MFECACGYRTDDENEFFAHLIECETEPEEKWSSYMIGRLAISEQEQPFLNSEILEEEEQR